MMSTCTDTRFVPDRPLLDTNWSCGCVLPSIAISAESSIDGANVILPVFICFPRAMMYGCWLPCSVLYAFSARCSVMLCSATFFTCVPPDAGPATPVTVRHDGYGCTELVLARPTADPAVARDAQVTLPVQ